MHFKPSTIQQKLRQDLVNATPFFRSERLLWALGAVLCIVWVAPAGPLYWDSFGYVAQAITGQVGGLFFGRPLFVLLSHDLATLAQRAGVSVWSMEWVLRVFWLAVSALSVPSVMTLVRSLGGSVASARWSALAMLTAPAWLHASGAVLTDAPALTAIILSTWCSVRGTQTVDQPTRSSLWFFSAGTVLALAFGLRESSSFHLLSLLTIALAVKRSHPWGVTVRGLLWSTLGVMLTSALILLWAYEQPGWLSTVQNWQAAMQREREQHPYALKDTLMYVGWLFALGPVALIAAGMQWKRWFAERKLQLQSTSTTDWVFAAIAMVSLAELLLLGVYQDIAFSPRYLLPALPGAVVLPAGTLLASRAKRTRTQAWLGALMVMIVLVTGAVLRWKQRPLREAIDETPQRLQQAGADRRLVIVTGQVCPAVQLATKLARVQAQRDSRPLPQWSTVCPGWDWPSDLRRTLDAYRAEGKTVIVDLRDAVWVGARQRQAMIQAQSYVTQARAQGIELTVW